MKIKYFFRHIRKVLIPSMLLFSSLYFAQNPDLEMADGDSNPTTNVTSVVQNTTIRLRKNTDNATGNTFATYANPSALTVSYSLSNQQYTQANFTGYNGAVFMGYTNEPVLTLMNAFGNTSAASFTSSGGAAVGTGIDIAVNRAVNFLANVQPLSAAGRATNQRWQMADLTLTFNRPVTNPYLQINALGGATNTIYYTTEMDYVSSNVPVTFSKVSGNATLNVTSTQILNNATVPDATLANSARGTVLVTGTGITTLVLRVYIRGAAANTGTNWHATSNTAGEGFMIGATVAESDLQVTQSANNYSPTVGSNVTFTVVARNLGASNNTGVAVADALPPGFTLVSATPSTGTYDSSTGVWTIGNLNDAATATLTIVGTMTRNGVFLNTATISGSVADPVSANNSASVQILSPDVDNDGVVNASDLDNDNDGILDAVECPATNLVTNGTFTSNLTGWTPGTGWTHDATQGYAYNVDNGLTTASSLLQSVSNLNTVPLNLVSVNMRIGAQDGSNAAGSTASLQVVLNNVVYATLSNSALRDNSNVTIAYANGASGTFTTFGTGSQAGYTQSAPFTVNIPYTGPSTANLEFRMTSGNDDWSVDDVSIFAACDNDGDGIPNNYDPDSDNDGCPDAIEGTEQVQFNQVHPLTLATTDANYPYRGQIKVTYNGVTAGTPSQVVSTSAAANGVPQLVNNAGNNLNAGTNAGNLAGVADNTDIPTPTTADIGQGIGTSQNSAATDTECTRCFRPATSPGVGGLPTNHGITALGRAGATNGNWPMKITGAYTALDAKTKGFVINRMPTTQLASIAAVVGMMVYDTTENCLKIYDNSGTWRCYNTQTCDNFNQ